MKTSFASGMLGISAAAVLAGCGVKTTTTNVVPSGATRTATCEAVVKTYDSRAEIPTDYYELAFIQAEANSVYTSDRKIEATIIKRAAEAGATAIIANPITESKVGVKVLGEALGTGSASSKASALAIYLPADAQRVMQLCGR